MIIWVLSLCIESTRMDICIPSSFLLLFKRFYRVWMRAFHSFCLKSINVSFFSNKWVTACFLMKFTKNWHIVCKHAKHKYIFFLQNYRIWGYILYCFSCIRLYCNRLFFSLYIFFSLRVKGLKMEMWMFGKKNLVDVLSYS